MAYIMNKIGEFVPEAAMQDQATTLLLLLCFTDELVKFRS